MGVSLWAEQKCRPRHRPLNPSPPGDTELSRLWLELSLRGVPGIKCEGTIRGQWSPVGAGFSRRSACLPGPQAAARHRRSSGTRRTRQVYSPPRFGRREQVPPPAPPLPLPQPRHSAAAGRGKGHFGAERQRRGMWRRGAWRRHSLPRPQAQPPPPHARRSAPSSPHLSPPVPQARDPRPPDPLRAQSAEGGGHLGRGRRPQSAPAGARASVARKWAGAGKGRPRRRGNGEGARHSSPAPRTGVPTGIGRRGGLQESLSGKSLAPWGLGG